MSVRSLPERPSLAQLKLQATELQRLHRDGKQSAGARIIAQHPRFASHSPHDVLAAPLKLADAQLVLAREYGFQSWAALKHFVGTSGRVAKFRSHPMFLEAVAAIDAGDLERLRALLDEHPELARSLGNLEPPFGYFTGATLLHYVAWNPSRPAKVPANIVDIARLLLERGADVDALTLSRSAGTTMGLIVTSKMASDANVSGPLIDLLREHGATLDLGTSAPVIPGWGPRNVLDVSLSNYALRAAEKLIELGAKPDLCNVAALGRLDLVKGFFDAAGRLRESPWRDGKQLAERDAIGLALLFAYVNSHPTIVDYLLEKDGNWNMIGVNNGTAMHRAAWSGDLPMIQRLITRGADISNRENPFNSTPLSWAQHNRQRHVVEWMRQHCAIDLLDAVGHNMREHVEARLREDPASANRRVDQWETPRSTALYWAAWTRISDVDGEHAWDKSSREDLVRMLLQHGADPNIVAGDGYTALDVAITAGAEGSAELIRAAGGRRSEDL
ncbi:MAG TPA: ankyrin repeat domain-containing protein [Gemmatimonadaceae bacterium]|nr:ankyrin repeat domain-containing protein [Gemmatimonadaceae bacterium]